jgi:hypothetical protein
MQINRHLSKELRTGKAWRNRAGSVCSGGRKDDDDNDNDDRDSDGYFDDDDTTNSTPKIKADMFTEYVYVIYMEEDKKAGTNSSSWRGILRLQLQVCGPLYFDREVRRFERTTFKILNGKSHFFNTEKIFYQIYTAPSRKFVNLIGL